MFSSSIFQVVDQICDPKVGALVVAVLPHSRRLVSIVKIREVYPSVKPPSLWLEWWILWFVRGGVLEEVHQSVYAYDVQYMPHDRLVLHLFQSIHQLVGPNHKLAAVARGEVLWVPCFL